MPLSLSEYGGPFGSDSAEQVRASLAHVVRSLEGIEVSQTTLITAVSKVMETRVAIMRADSLIRAIRREMIS